MATKKKIDPIYSPEHYQMKRLVRSKRFQSQLRKLHQSWKSHGVTVPTNGFKRAKDYYSWVAKLRSACNKAMDSQEVADAIMKVNNNPSLSPTEKVWRRFEVQKSCTPPTPHGAVDKLLKACSLNPKNEQYRRFITKYIFFGQREFSKPFFTVHGKRNKETDEWGIFLKLEGHTKPGHIVKFWSQVDAYLKLLPDYVGKNKPWEEFERDLEIFETYQGLKSSLPGKRARYQSDGFTLDSRTWQMLRERDRGKYEKLTLSQVRKSVSKIAALDD
ncbi:MAG: hypothetical protein ABH846_04415 [Patescibacteria group bacterium]